MTTKAAILYASDRPLEVADVATPELKAGQVLAKVECSGVCASQLMEVRGKRGPDRSLPHLLGHEGAGVVLQVGPDVRKVREGDRVVLTWIKSSGADAGGSQYLRGSETVNAGPVTTLGCHAVVSENRCVKIDADIPPDVAALFGCAVLTGSGMVLNTIRPSPNDTIAVWGAGGVGLAAVIAAKLSGCRVVVAVDVQDTKLELATTLGATHCVNASREDAPDRIREIVGSNGVDYAVDAAGRAATIEMAFSSVRKNGGLCVFASHPPFGERICLDPHELISGKNIKGSWGGESVPDRDIPRFVELYRAGKLPLEKLITHRYRLDEINKALGDLEKGLVGRPMIEMM